MYHFSVKKLLFVLVLILIRIVSAQFGTDVLVDRGPANMTFGCCEAELVCGSDSTIYCVWFDDRVNPLMQANIYMSKSTDEGQTWSVEIKVDDQSSWHQISPAIAIDQSDNLYCVWHQMAGSEHILFSKSTDGGTTWSASVPVDNTPPGTYIGSPDIVVNDNNDILVVWDDNRSGTYQCQFSKSTDGGATWTTDLQFGGSQGQSPKLVYRADTLYVVFGTYTSVNDVFFTRSNDNGATWSSRVTVHSVTTGAQRYGDIGISSNNVLHAVWYDWRTSLCDIRHAKSTDGGSTWLPSVSISDTTFDQNYYFGMEMHLECAGENWIYCTWDDWRNGNNNGYYDIWFTMSGDTGNTWLTPNLVVNDSVYSTSQRYPTLCLAADGNPCVAFSDNRQYGIHLYFDKGNFPGVIENRQENRENVLLSSCPNPFSSRTKISYTVPSTSNTELRVYDISGKLVKTIFVKAEVPGTYTCFWHGEDASGRKLPAGVYFLKYQTGSLVTTEKLTLLR